MLCRRARFFIEAIVLNRWGDFIRERIERHLTLFVILFLVVLVAGFIIAIKTI